MLKFIKQLLINNNNVKAKHEIPVKEHERVFKMDAAGRPQRKTGYMIVLKSSMDRLYIGVW